MCCPVNEFSVSTPNTVYAILDCLLRNAAFVLVISFKISHWGEMGRFLSTSKKVKERKKEILSFEI